MNFAPLPNCDTCGRFVNPGQVGSSWVCVPYSDVSMGDERYRCARCTQARGPAQAMGDYVRHLVEGIVSAPHDGAAGGGEG